MVRLLPTAVFPILFTLNNVVVADCVEEPIAKSVVVVAPLLACTLRFANGEVLPIPRLVVAKRATSVPPVENAIALLLLPGLKSPVFELLTNESAGNAALPLPDN